VSHTAVTLEVGALRSFRIRPERATGRMLDQLPTEVLQLIVSRVSSMRHSRSGFNVYRLWIKQI
jgi:hypothetical protein